MTGGGESVNIVFELDDDGLEAASRDPVFPYDLRDKTHNYFILVTLVDIDLIAYYFSNPPRFVCRYYSNPQILYLRLYSPYCLKKTKQRAERLFLKTCFMFIPLLPIDH